MLSSKVGAFLQTRGMHTLIRDKEISKHDFVFYSNRLIRLVGNALYKITGFTALTNKLMLISLDLQVVEHGLGYLPFTEKQVTTPTGLSLRKRKIILSIKLHIYQHVF
jgi:uridine kinase